MTREKPTRTNPSGAAEVARLRARIDNGETRDKVDYPDPAAAPLGTDDEAAGHPPTRHEVQMADQPPLGDDTRRSRPHRSLGTGTVVGLALIVVMGLVFLLVGAA